MHYHISFQNPLTHFITIRLTVGSLEGHNTTLQLPSWRPGRYELANYAKNIRRYSAYTASGEGLKVTKISKDTWSVAHFNISEFTLEYEYFAHQMDAGGSWLDEHQLYLNFVNCMLYVVNRQQEPCTLDFELPEVYKIACGLAKTAKHQLYANDYYRMVDSPMIASAQLTCYSYQVDEVQLYLWIQGKCNLDKEKTIAHFEAFTKSQSYTMGGLPFEEYHFLYQMLPYRHYHGVEHFNSTVITLGPSKDIAEPEFYENFLGVSSHELFHAWNVIRIRPLEMSPYDFSRENYFRTGYVAEGFTTYYGDLFLFRSEVFDLKWYILELEKLFKRHFDNYGRFHCSVMEASFDLWLDGYTRGIPHRKTSIYTKGAIVALMLDLQLRQCSDQRYSLDDLMRQLWEKYGLTGKGYTHEDILALASELCGESMAPFFTAYIAGTIDLETPLRQLLDTVGFELTTVPADYWWETLHGFRLLLRGTQYQVLDIAPGSIAEQALSIGDTLLNINGRQLKKEMDLQSISMAEIATGSIPKTTLTIKRNHEPLDIEILGDKNPHYQQFKINIAEKPSESQLAAFRHWSGQNLTIDQ